MLRMLKMSMSMNVNKEMLAGNADAFANYYDTDHDASEFYYRL